MINNFVLDFLGYIFIQKIIPSGVLKLRFGHKVIEILQKKRRGFEGFAIPLQHGIQFIGNDCFIHFFALFSFDHIQYFGMAMYPFGPEVYGEVCQGRILFQSASVSICRFQYLIIDLVALQYFGGCQACAPRSDNDHFPIIIIAIVQSGLLRELIDSTCCPIENEG